CSFFLTCCAAHRDLHSFPTRRSSDLSNTSVKPGYNSCCTDMLMLIRHSFIPAQSQCTACSQAVSSTHEPIGTIAPVCSAIGMNLDRKSTRLNSSHVKISYAVFCLKKK